MGMVSLHELFREIAERETRSVIVTLDGGPLPKDEYGFTEWYCIDPECDCRRVLVKAIAVGQRKEVATINYAFEPPEDGHDDQLFLDPLHRHAPFADALLDVFQNLLADRAYVARLERHYAMVKRFVADPDDPRARTFREENADTDVHLQAVVEALADGTFVENISRGTFTEQMMRRAWVPAGKGRKRAQRRGR